jgi:hypothetical protein
MNKDKLNEIFTLFLGTLSVVAIFALLINNKFKTNDVLSGIVNFTQVAIPVLVLLVTTTIRKENKSLVETGKEALVDLRKKHPDFLMGPRYNRENYDPEKGKGVEYLFVTNADPKSRLRAKFIPVQPFEYGEVAIYVQKGTLVYGLGYSSEQATQEEITRIRQDIRNSLLEFISKKYQGFFETEENVKDDTAIIIIFDTEALGKKKFRRAIFECAEFAVSRMVTYKKSKLL